MCINYSMEIFQKRNYVFVAGYLYIINGVKFAFNRRTISNQFKNIKD